MHIARIFRIMNIFEFLKPFMDILSVKTIIFIFSNERLYLHQQLADHKYFNDYKISPLKLLVQPLQMDCSAAVHAATFSVELTCNFLQFIVQIATWGKKQDMSSTSWKNFYLQLLSFSNFSSYEYLTIYLPCENPHFAALKSL